jgi:DNA-binding SARP family transcriptional activator
MARPSALRRGTAPEAASGRPKDGRVATGVPVVELRLVQGFEVLHRGESIELPLLAQRLVAFLALQERPRQRAYVAATLWIDTAPERAFASLRSAIWRVRQSGAPLICAPDTRLALDPDVQVDLAAALELARRLLGDDTECDVRSDDLVPLKGEILPDWYDDWLMIERETHRQLRLHALEALAVRLTNAGRFGEAVAAAMAAVEGEPLRESAHRVLCQVYLAEGNVSEALRSVELYRELLMSELGLRPSPQFERLVAGVTPG